MRIISKMSRIKDVFTRVSTWFVIVILVIAGASSYIGYVYLHQHSVSTTSTSTTTTSTTTTSSYTTTQYPNIGQKFIEIKAFDVTKGSNGGTTVQFIAGNDYSATQLLSLVESIHDAIGNFSLIRFVRTECQGGIVNPNLTASQIQAQSYSGNSNYNWNGTLNSYFTAIQKAAGGQIIPDADMDIYFGDTDCLSQFKTDQTNNPTYQNDYFADAASLLTLNAIADGDRYVMLESWDAYYANDNPSQNQVETFFQKMQALGWTGFMPQANNPAATGQGPQTCSSKNAPFPDFGYGGYVRNGLFWINSTAPYVFPHFNTICSIEKSEPYLNGVVLAMESQSQGSPADQAYCDGNYMTAGGCFNSLSQSEQETALTYLASNQAKYDYIWVYPVLIGEHGVEYDAEKAGTLTYMESLINQYN